MIFMQAQEGVENLTFEASSHALDQRRIEGLPIDVAVFSNLSRDHLDYHGSMDAYAKAKSRLFKKQGIQRGVVFLDNQYSKYILDSALCPIYTYSLQDAKASFYASDLVFSANGVSFKLQTPLMTTGVILPLLGEFNVANALAALAANWDLFNDKALLVQSLSSLTGAPGRMQQIDIENKPLVVIDYAHTPDALSVALQALQQHTSGCLLCVYGCGGDRDKGKRPLMTQAALQQSEIAYLTSDNPRKENPEDIMQEAIKNVAEVDEQLKKGSLFLIVDRKQAIMSAIMAAKPEDTILIAGKGHENYQEVQNVKYYFNDVEEAKKALNQC